MSFSRQVARNQRGAAVIETALLAPILATMVIGMVQVGQAFSMKLRLEQASQRAIEKIMNGQADKSSAAALKTEAATIAEVPETNVTVDFWHECNGTKMANYADVCSSGQVDKRYMSVSINKPFTPMFASKLTGANADGSYTMNGFTVVRTQ
ncbi:MAG: pilus assembly protein [Sphingomonas sp.]|nr:pilus assembly protein [Sphingomonas sp.]